MTTKTTKKAAGGKARAASMSPSERSESARNAAQAKADMKNLPKATHGSADHPLKIGDVELPCYVLEDGTRVLSQRGVVAGLGMKYGSRSSGDDRITSFLGGKAISPFVNSELMQLVAHPIKFRTSMGGGLAFGYPATVLADICDVVLSARAKGALQKQQEHIAAQAEILVRGFARVGIIALVDEATGYQRERAKDALAKILEAWVAKELQPYVKTFPTDFYEHLFRLRGLEYPPERENYRPQYFGVLTNDIVYQRLAPGLLEEMKKQAAKDEKKAHLHRRLTEQVGHPRLKEHLASVTTIMKLSKNYPDFIEKINQIHPRFGDTYALNLDVDDR
ncbi:P63C domain-containing protein [Pantoea sp. 18069]|uniref:P63C domain-containing protein n=1 Tax=Pantoea sp. 18069 TaxID=2681415 RepID=UPI0013569F4F|nr:P63C domain-containing protein [Pantoea sp. 18069]